ncbi:MAG: hypothetical protein VX228_13735, partial [Pseudomonadota bacterium]|nr:hypothetical protein [Pseudomonadota bacterium]
MTWLAVLISALLFVPAALHLLWAIGAWVPIRDEAALARATVGAPGISKMPGSIPCALVFVALSFAAALPHLTTFPLRTLLLPAIAAVFLLRGIAAYLPAWLAACLAGCLPACLAAWLPGWLAACLPAWLAACLHGWL